VLGFKTGTSPYENQDSPLNPLMMLLSYRASWVGQAYAGKAQHLAEMLEQAIGHRGFSYLHVLSPCVTFDKTSMTYENLDMRVRQLSEKHNSANMLAAMSEARHTEVPALGVFYKEQRPTLGDGLNKIIEHAQHKG
jgi:2-oxoglutarate ferredoxin oxidoreductase subunit beta